MHAHWGLLSETVPARKWREQDLAEENMNLSVVATEELDGEYQM